MPTFWADRYGSSCPEGVLSRSCRAPLFLAPAGAAHISPLYNKRQISLGRKASSLHKGGKKVCWQEIKIHLTREKGNRRKESAGLVDYIKNSGCYPLSMGNINVLLTIFIRGTDLTYGEAARESSFFLSASSLPRRDGGGRAGVLQYRKRCCQP